MRLTVGSKAPPLSRVDLRGDHVDLKAWSDKPIWVGFFRFASCPLCNLRVHQMIRQWPRFEKSCHYVAVFQSPASRFEGFLTKHSPPFPVIADPELELFSAFGVENSLAKALSLDVVTRTVDAMKMGFPLGALGPKDGAALRVPADFVIDPTGAITMAFYRSNVSESVPFDTVGKVLGC